MATGHGNHCKKNEIASINISTSTTINGKLHLDILRIIAASFKMNVVSFNEPVLWFVAIFISQCSECAIYLYAICDISVCNMRYICMR